MIQVVLGVADALLQGLAVFLQGHMVQEVLGGADGRRLLVLLHEPWP